ncbi:hypothetical protein [Exiguobacterium undae]|uniref:Ribbon-helix-helix protein CopG domain-containing protein n=1 Tax=Exiguobacterium undae TaxID=169177 RepID=A0ABX2V4W4_9BACL|nr:hypothetical protein [Exiguobacterium undae]OAN10129.1 hypothetical protein A3783_15305 [Exiguobacterium undae]
MSRSRKKGQPTFKSFQGTVTEPSVNDSATESLRDEQIEAVKKFAAPAISNPYQSLPATGLSRILTKRLPQDVDGLVQYYNHIDTIQATSFVEKCRILAHANALFHSEETRAQFKAEQGSWTDFLTKIGQTRSQVSRYVSFWNVFGEKILQKVIDVDFSASKLAELLTWPEDPKLALLEERKYPTQNGELTVYEMTREQLREVKRMLIERQEQRTLEAEVKPVKPMKVQIRFPDLTDPLFIGLTQAARKEQVSEDEIIRRALQAYLKTN